jgi:hypothetical protein
MAIRQDRRAPNAGLGMLDFSTTARLGEKGTDLVTETVMAKQNEQKLKFEQARLDEKNARIAQGQWQGMAQNTPELLTFYEEAGGEVSKAFERSQNGRSSLTDNLILQGAGQNFVASKKEQQASQLAELQTQQIIDQNIEKSAVGKAMAKSYVKDEDGDITFDSSIGAEFISNNAPQYMNTFATQAGNINAQSAQIQSIKDKDSIAWSQAETAKLKAQTENATSKIEVQNLNAMSAVNETAYLTKQAGSTMARKDAVAVYSLNGGTDYVEFYKTLDSGTEAGLFEKSKTDKKEEEDLIQQQTMKATSFVADSITNSLQAISKVDSILKNLGEESALSMFNPRNYLKTGILSYIPNVGSAEIQADLEVIVSDVTLEKIAEMKAQSETGATGLGQVSIPEFTTLGADIEALRDAQRGGQSFFVERLQNFAYTRSRLALAQFEAYKQKFDLTTDEAMERLPVGSFSYDDIIKELKQYEELDDRFRDNHGGGYVTILAENKNYYPDVKRKNTPVPTPTPTPQPTPADPNAFPPMLSYGQGSGQSRFTINSYPSN